jgi:hypothetical protein
LKISHVTYQGDENWFLVMSIEMHPSKPQRSKGDPNSALKEGPAPVESKLSKEAKQF